MKVGIKGLRNSVDVNIEEALTGIEVDEIISNGNPIYGFYPAYYHAKSNNNTLLITT